MLSQTNLRCLLRRRVLVSVIGNSNKSHGPVSLRQVASVSSSSGSSGSGNLPVTAKATTPAGQSFEQQRPNGFLSLSMSHYPRTFLKLQQRPFHAGSVLLDEKSEAEAPAVAAAPPAADTKAATPPADAGTDTPREYSTPELTEDAAKHKAGLYDDDRPFYQNPLHHNNPEMKKFFREDFDSEEEFQKAIQPMPPLENTDGSYAAPEYLKELADEMVNLTMLEMNELVNKISGHYGFYDAMLEPGGEAGGDGGGDDDDEDGAAVVEKTTFDVKLLGFDTKAKIKVIKEVRALAGLGLKEAKELVEGAPTIIQKDLKKEAAEEIKAKLEELGAQVEIV